MSEPASAMSTARASANLGPRRFLRTPLGKVAVLGGFLGVLAVVGLVLLEVGCQVYALSVFSGFEKQKADPGHYYRASGDPVLVYELAPGYDREIDGRRLVISSRGVRESEPSPGTASATPALGIVGDSVVFGTGLSQDQTLPARLGALLGGGGEAGAPGATPVVNLGVPGYSLGELPRHLELAGQRVPLSAVVYVLNLNDFSRRDSVYEGADNGLYRMYHRPTLMTPWFVRKGLYRLNKGGVTPDPAWYRWLFRGTRGVYLPQIERMAAWARGKGVGFRVVILPAGVGYTGGSYVLADVHGEIAAYLASRQIACDEAAGAFSGDVTALIDATDHFTPAGAEVMAAWLAERLRNGPGPGGGGHSPGM